MCCCLHKAGCFASSPPPSLTLAVPSGIVFPSHSCKASLTFSSRPSRALKSRLVLGADGNPQPRLFLDLAELRQWLLPLLEEGGPSYTPSERVGTWAFSCRPLALQHQAGTPWQTRALAPWGTGTCESSVLRLGAPCCTVSVFPPSPMPAACCRPRGKCSCREPILISPGMLPVPQAVMERLSNKTGAGAVVPLYVFDLSIPHLLLLDGAHQVPEASLPLHPPSPSSSSPSPCLASFLAPPVSSGCRHARLWAPCHAVPWNVGGVPGATSSRCGPYKVPSPWPCRRPDGGRNSL